MNVLLEKFFLNISGGVAGGSIVYLASKEANKLSGIDIFIFILLIVALLSSFFVIKKQGEKK
ncbi:hypothetical protein [Sulfurimonas sp.]|uniref:hypothetical protein n=1 Tax=Sulfurimonas sp. TaxID=2022749 RepID=UPI002A369843|nr:hypothetical protein [Sulfurimonas sp.]MDY0123539.1 hypothetical protein [Sulfurimonas sp.]